MTKLSLLSQSLVDLALHNHFIYPLEQFFDFLRKIFALVFRLRKLCIFSIIIVCPLAVIHLLSSLNIKLLIIHQQYPYTEWQIQHSHTSDSRHMYMYTLCLKQSPIQGQLDNHFTYNDHLVNISDQSLTAKIKSNWLLRFYF